MVVDAAVGGDKVAIGILERQADEVVTLASAALRRLHLTSCEVPVVLGGSVSAALPRRFIERIGRGVRRTAPLASCVVCRDRPIVGAALTALDLGGAGAESRERARRMLNDDCILDVAC
jgi:hypothetical protein